jgi:peptidoglycan hydrolase-like protein with peptidoglycan-binding domain
MAWRPLVRGAVVGIIAAGSLVLGTGAALAGDNNHNGQIDRGDTGTAVWCVQHVVHSYFGISVGSSGEDSSFGPGTERGVRIYQGPPYHTNLAVDGQVGRATGHAMLTDVNTVRRNASQHGDTATFNDTSHWLATCPPASSVFS